MKIEYELQDAGWAWAFVSDAEHSYRPISVSYLTDALCDLAKSAIRICEGSLKETFYWVEEPAAHKVILSRQGNEIAVELMAIEDGMFADGSEEDGPIMFKTTTTVREYAQVVHGILEDILCKYGPEKYKEKWINHEFPMKELLRLRSITANQAL